VDGHDGDNKAGAENKAARRGAGGAQSSSAYLANEARLRSLHYDLVLRFLALLLISQAGFLRLLLHDKRLRFPLFLSIALDLLANLIPLLVLQLVNLQSLANEELRQDLLLRLSLWLSAGCLFAHLLELFMHQLLNKDSEYSLLSQKDLGVREKPPNEGSDGDSQSPSDLESSDEDSESSQ